MRPAPIPSKDSFSSVAYGCYQAVAVLGPAGFIQVDAKVSDPVWDAAWDVTSPIGRYALGASEQLEARDESFTSQH